jgi:hypothetical protein
MDRDARWTPKRGRKLKPDVDARAATQIIVPVFS